MRSLYPWPTFPFNLDLPIARSLSIQFILQELLTSFDLIHDLKLATPLQLQGANLKEELICISKELEKFLLFSLDNPIGLKSSALDKLCFYCEILLQASHIGDTKILMLVDEMRNAVLSTKSHIFVSKKNRDLPSLTDILNRLMTLYTQLKIKLDEFFLALSPFLKEARSDENVLIYLLEHKEKFNSYLGPRCIEDLFRSFFPSGYDQFRAAIFEGYTRRGFTQFLATVEPLLDALEVEWDEEMSDELGTPPPDPEGL